MRNSIFIVMIAVLVGVVTIISQSGATYSQTDHKDSLADNFTPHKIMEKRSLVEKLYKEIGLEDKLQYDAFEKAMVGYEQLNPKNKNIISIIDFTLPSTEKRLYVIDIKNKKLLYHTIVSHGRNSGEKYATSFSNRHGSHQSSLGFYITENTYQGGNGYSLVLNGLEKGINDQAKPRAVVIHGADYCSEAVINSTGRLGRSYGCPALPRELAKPIINTIKNGTMLFIYAQDQDYMAQSKILKQSQSLLAQHIDDADSSSFTY